MSDIFATPAAGTLRPTGIAGGAETAVRVVDPSPDLARLASGENLRGTVVSKDDRGHLLVRTRLGVLTLAATRPLPVGTEVVLQVRSVGPQVLLTLLPLNTGGSGGSGGNAPAGPAAPAPTVQPQGPPPTPGAPTPGAPTPGAPTPATPAPSGPGDLVQRGQLLRAILHAAPPMPSLAGLPTAQPGTELMARILSLGVQATAPAPAAGTLPATMPAIPAPTGSPAPAGSPAATGNPSAPALGGTTAPATPGGPGGAQQPFPQAGAHPPGKVAQPGQPPQSGQVPAGVSPAAGTGGAIPGLRHAPQIPVASSGHSLATALQGLSADAAARAAGSLPATGGSGAAATAMPGGPVAGAPADAAAGALRVTGMVTAATGGGQPILHTPLGTLTLDTRAALPPGTSLALEIVLPPTSAGPPPTLAAAWPSLESLEETLFHGLPAAQGESIARALPQVGPRLASGVLFFLSALNQGNVAGWLARGAAPGGDHGDRGDLLDRLGREFAGLSRNIETSAGEWRLVNLPLWSEQGLRELRCFFRHQDHGGRPGEDGEKATRFVLELELKRHGELQLDGLVRARHFDLVLRSRRPLPALVRGDLMALFEETNAIAGYDGRLSFQSSRDWLQLLAARSAAEPHEGFRV